jgi:hypothetical protein
MKRSRAAVITAIAALACASLAAMAVAHTERFDSEVTLKIEPNAANPDRGEGKVKSDRANCERNRLVKLKKLVDGPNETVGTDTTNDAGEYNVDPPGDLASGDYRAVAPRTVRRNNEDHKHVCKTGKSNDKHVP